MHGRTPWRLYAGGGSCAGRLILHRLQSSISGSLHESFVHECLKSLLALRKPAVAAARPGLMAPRSSSSSMAPLQRARPRERSKRPRRRARELGGALGRLGYTSAPEARVAERQCLRARKTCGSLLSPVRRRLIALINPGTQCMRRGPALGWCARDDSCRGPCGVPMRRADAAFRPRHET